MSIVKKSIIGFFALVAIILLTTVIDRVERNIQESQNAATASDITNPTISDTPFGAPITVLLPNHTYYLNSHIVRDGDCFVDSNWWFLQKFSGGRVAAWGYYGGRLLSHAGDNDRSIAFETPKSMIPGHYTVSRQMRFQCQDDGGHTDAQTSVAFDVN